MRRTIKLGVVTLAAAMVLSAAQAQHTHHSGASAPAGSYTPRLADLMIMQQIRHSKLWFAVAANNWALAEHGFEEITAGFANVARLYPTFHEVAVTSVIRTLNERELPELARAIEARDRIKFTVAFDQLTAGCNACHQAAKRGFVVIQQPISPPFNNQSFAPLGGQPSHSGDGHSHPH